MEILTNQAGFDLGAPKFVVVQADGDSGPQPGRVQVVNGQGMLRYEASLEYVGTVRGWRRCYWRGDISAFDEAGDYEVRARVGLQQVRQELLTIGPQQVARRTLAAAAGFYYYQRCGCEVPGWHAPCHLDDARLPDGSHLDATGGWHDGGDYNKYSGYTPLAVFALAQAARHPLAVGDDLLIVPQVAGRAGAKPGPYDTPPPHEEAAWGGQWLAKMQDPATGLLRGDVFSGYQWWGPPESETDNVPGNDDDRPVRGEPSAAHRAGSALLAFGALAKLRLGETQWLECAQRLAAGAADAVGAHGGAPLPLGEQAAAALGYLELPGAVARQRADALVRGLLDHQGADGSFHEPHLVDEGFVPALLASYALRDPGAPLTGEIQRALLRYLDFVEARTRNPFRVLQWDRANFFYPYPEPNAWYVGHNSAYLSLAWALALLAKFLTAHDAAAARTAAPRARALARSQLDWVLGCNPFGICMLEGAGQFHPPRYHHRYDSLPGRERGAVPGAVCSGIVRSSVDSDAPRFDLRGNDYHSNEPWLPHNAYYLLAVAET